MLVCVDTIAVKLGKNAYIYEKKIMDYSNKHWSPPTYDPITNTEIFKLLNKHNKHQPT